MKNQFSKFFLATSISALIITGCGNVAEKPTDETATERKSDSNTDDSKLKKLSDLVNKNVPFKVDDITTLTGTTIPAPNTLQYEYKVAEIKKADLDETKLPGIIESLKPGLIENAKTNKEMELLRELNTNLIYLYKDVNGDELYRVELSGNEY